MADIVTKEVLDEVEKEFKKKYNSSKKIQSLAKKLEDGLATCEDAFEYSKEVGNLKKDVLFNSIEDGLLGEDGALHYYDAKALFEDALYKNYELINEYCKEAFTQANKRANIGLKGVSTPYEQDKTDGIVECAVKDVWEKTKNETGEAIKTNAKSYYDSSVKRNADFQYKSGLHPKIIRTAIGKTCKWCQSLAGTYDYYDVSNTGNDVFRRHANCDCVVVYSPRKGKYKDVYSKKNMNTKEYKESVENLKKIDKKKEEERSIYSKYTVAKARQELSETSSNIKEADKKVVDIYKKIFNGYDPAKLVDGNESASLLEIKKNSHNTYKFVNSITNVAMDSGTSNVNIGNDALANSLHERTHDIVNQLAIKRAKILDLNNVTPIQLELFKQEKSIIEQRIYNICFNDETYDEINKIIKDTLSERATDSGSEFLAEGMVDYLGSNNPSSLSKKIYNYLTKEWKK